MWLHVGCSDGRGLQDICEIILSLDGMLGCLWSVGVDKCNVRREI